MTDILVTCRTHNDITVLYDSFVMKRKLIKDAVRKNIEEFYQKEKGKSSNVSSLCSQEQSISITQEHIT